MIDLGPAGHLGRLMRVQCRDYELEQVLGADPIAAVRGYRDREAGQVVDRREVHLGDFASV